MNEQHPATEPLLTYRDAARLLGVSDRTVWTLVATGALRAVRFRHAVRIDPADLQEFIEQAKGGQGVGRAR